MTEETQEAELRFQYKDLGGHKKGPGTVIDVSHVSSRHESKTGSTIV